MEFISYEGPAEARAGKTKHAIRSYVTKRQHRLRREAEQKASAGNQSHCVYTSPHLYQQTPSKSLSLRLSQLVGLASSNADEKTISGTPELTPPQRYGLSSSRRIKQGLADRGVAARKIAIFRMCTSLSLPPRIPYEPMLPCDTALNTLESYLHATMFPTHIAALGLDPSESQVASQWFSASCICEPALYTSALLTATMNIKQSSPDLVHYLQSTTINSLVQALADAQRRQDPALIIAVSDVLRVPVWRQVSGANSSSSCHAKTHQSPRRPRWRRDAAVVEEDVPHG